MRGLTAEAPARAVGQRVVAGQRPMQASSDIFLGWQRIEAGLDERPRDFYVRQLQALVDAAKPGRITAEHGL